MNRITKLLMENKVTINAGITSDMRGETPTLVIYIETDFNKLPSKRELLQEVPSMILVSTIEWELLHYWKDNGIKTIRKNYINENIQLDNYNDYYCQPIGVPPLFKFVNHNEIYNLDELIERCVLIEG